MLESLLLRGISIYHVFTLKAHVREPLTFRTRLRKSALIVLTIRESSVHHDADIVPLSDVTTDDNPATFTTKCRLCKVEHFLISIPYCPIGMVYYSSGFLLAGYTLRVITMLCFSLSYTLIV